MHTPIAAFITALALGSTALAQLSDPAPDADTQPGGLSTAPHDPLRFTFAPYFWLASMDGQTAVGDTTSDVDLPFTDVITESDTIYGLQGHLELGRGRWSVFFDATWVHSEVDDIPGQVQGTPADFDLASDLAIIEFGGVWILAQGLLEQAADSGAPRAWHVDAMLGARVDVIEVEIEATPEAGGDSSRRSRTEEWIEPFVGVRGGLDLSENWRLQARADVGGFGIGSDFAWQVAALCGYDFQCFGTDTTFFFGYRALGQDYSEGSGDDHFEWDVIIHGPIIGLSFQF